MIAMAFISKERNIQLFKATYDFLLSKKPEDVQLEKYFVGENRDF